MKDDSDANCPRCDAVLTTPDDRFSTWCAARDWNVDPLGPVDVTKSRDHELAHHDGVFRRTAADGPDIAPPGAAAYGALVLATAVNLATVAWWPRGCGCCSPAPFHSGSWAPSSCWPPCRCSRARRGGDLWEALRDYLASVPDGKQARRLRLSELRGGASGSGYPPTCLRIRFVHAFPRTEPALTVTGAEARTADPELAAIRSSIGRECPQNA
ncbi:hypothetical protein ACFXPV_31930 [Streptomyces sp. NPDC059118]|uniref:hypothetical protein n=1 Tax=unclassified Streptomyces TaxID=2593676 RepID=UPI0036969F36